MNKIIVQLRGGLGNQLFQYATSKAISLDNDIKLFIDTFSGFKRDYEFNRKFELDNSTISGKVAKNFSIFPIYLFLFKNRFNKSIPKLRDKIFNFHYIHENEFQYLPQIKQGLLGKSTYIIGSWQSYKYFEHHKNLLYKELQPLIPKNKKYLQIGQEMKNTNSVALGLRLYEEASNPNLTIKSTSKNGKIKNIREISNAIKKIQSQIPEAKFYIFCTHNSAIFSEFNLPKDTKWITAEEGFDDTRDTLWLLTQCRNHLFTHSSYYWWGAWLSEVVYKESKQLILAADNFLNEHTIPERWETF